MPLSLVFGLSLLLGLGRGFSGLSFEFYLDQADIQNHNESLGDSIDSCTALKRKLCRGHWDYLE